MFEGVCDFKESMFDLIVLIEPLYALYGSVGD